MRLSLGRWQHRATTAPPDPSWNDTVPYESKWLMDDGVVLEPMVGNRGFHSGRCLDETMQLVWRREGVNVEKMAEEGHPSACQLLWGLFLNFDTWRLRSRSQNASRRNTSTKFLSKLAGCAQYWAVVCPGPHRLRTSRFWDPPLRSSSAGKASPVASSFKLLPLYGNRWPFLASRSGPRPSADTRLYRDSGQSIGVIGGSWWRVPLSSLTH